MMTYGSVNYTLERRERRALNMEPSAKVKEMGKIDFMITVSFLEIYNEEIKDLLNPSSKQMKIRENKDKGIYVEGLCEVVVKEPRGVLELIEQGNVVRRVAATQMNDTSSRSHSVFTIKIEQRTVAELDGGVTKTQMVKAKLNLVDLAGRKSREDRRDWWNIERGCQYQHVPHGSGQRHQRLIRDGCKQGKEEDSYTLQR